MNIQHPTSNLQHPMGAPRRKTTRSVNWMLGLERSERTRTASPSKAGGSRRRSSIGCWMLDVFPRLLSLLFPVLSLALIPASQAADKPNIIFILADDLGYGDIGCNGQKLIQTPNIDRMAAEGMRSTQFYAGAPVCAPSRAVLMTGLHVGHVSVRGNAGPKPLSDQIKTGPQTLAHDEATVAEVLKKSGYTTALIGKWGLGELGTGSEPTKRGFDYFFGYLNQTHAHNYYPAYLVRNESEVKLQNEVPGTGPFGQNYATKKVEYSADLFAAEAAKWIGEHKAGPFFLYLAL